MTIYELECDLKTLAEAQENDERLRLAIRGRLADQLQPPPRRRLRRRLVFGLAAVAAAGAASIAMLIGTTNSGGPTPANAAILHHTLRAVTPPPNTILHVKVVGGRDGTQFSGETWQQTAAPYASRGMKGPVGSQEFADNGTTSFLYDPSTNTIYERPDSSPPTFVDPVASLRQALNNGSAHVEGTVVIAGESLYKIELPKGLVGYFDTSTYMPRYLDGSQRDGTDVLRLRFVTYEYLPMTDTNAKLLSVTAEHPNARIDTKPSDSPSGK